MYKYGQKTKPEKNITEKKRLNLTENTVTAYKHLACQFLFYKTYEGSFK